ncbi:hypothetical protein [Amycolatopsis circi]|uniref:hypothetical protein n=1 Tax=Amycolatopsis circi TaxID=871959 RepID=UPI000E26D7F1|nr:hypothetical protein [Amycolatopsis circi]
MTDADTPRVPDLREHVRKARGYAEAVARHHPEAARRMKVIMMILDQPADAVKLGDVEAARDTGYNNGWDVGYAKGWEETRAELDKLRVDIRAVLDGAEIMLVKLDLIRAILDREPGREEPGCCTACNGGGTVPSGYPCEDCYATGHCHPEGVACGPTALQPAPAPRTLLGWIVPDHVMTFEVAPGTHTLWCFKHMPRVGSGRVVTPWAVSGFLRYHAHGQVVEHQPEEGDRG